jgi:hypothetical protein
MYRDWQVIRFTLSQTSQAAVAEYTIRTPVGQPDVTVSLTEPDLTRLLLRHTEVAPMLDQVLCALAEGRGDGSSKDTDEGRGGRGDCWFDFDPSIQAQVAPGDWHEPPGVRDAVSRLLAGLESRDWRERDKAETVLGKLGREAALYLLLRLDRSTLTSQQNMAVDRVLRHYPLLSAADRELCRREPSRLRPIAREPGLALLGVRGEPVGGPDSTPTQDTLTARATTAPAFPTANLRAVADNGR